MRTTLPVKGPCILSLEILADQHIHHILGPQTAAYTESMCSQDRKKGEGGGCHSKATCISLTLLRIKPNALMICGVKPLTVTRRSVTPGSSVSWPWILDASECDAHSQDTLDKRGAPVHDRQGNRTGQLPTKVRFSEGFVHGPGTRRAEAKEAITASFAPAPVQNESGTVTVVLPKQHRHGFQT